MQISKESSRENLRSLNTIRANPDSAVIEESQKESKMTEANVSEESDKTVDDLGEFSKYIQSRPKNYHSPNRNQKMNYSMAHS